MATREVVVAGAAGAVAGALLAAAAAALLGGRDPGVPRAEVEALRARLEAAESARRPPRDPAVEASAEETAARLAAQERRIADLEAALAEARRAAPSRAPGAAPAPAAEEAPPAPAEERPADAAAAAVRRRKGLPTEDLLQEVRGMLGGAGRAIDGRALVDACDLLLARTLDPDARAEALLARGVGQRVLGDRAKEEASFREALELAGPTTPRGREARSQLAWTAARGGDARAAADAFAGLASETDAPERQRAWNRLYAAQHYGRAGDRERERAAYRAVTEEFGATDDVDAKRAVEQARRWLERP